VSDNGVTSNEQYRQTSCAGHFADPFQNAHRRIKPSGSHVGDLIRN
jgi:hypothetical protein